MRIEESRRRTLLVIVGHPEKETLGAVPDLSLYLGSSWWGLYKGRWTMWLWEGCRRSTQPRLAQGRTTTAASHVVRMRDTSVTHPRPSSKSSIGNLAVARRYEWAEMQSVTSLSCRHA